MNILIFGMTQNPGGIESVIMNYYKKIDRDRFNFDFLCNTQVVAYEQEILNLGGKIYKIAMRSQNRKKYYEDLNSFFSQHASHYDAIWVNVCSLANIDYLKYAKKYGIKKRIIHSHNSQNMDSFFRGVLHRVNKLVLTKYATDFWSCSEDASKWFYSKKIMLSEKHHIIHNGIDINRFKYSKKKRIEGREKHQLQNKFVVGNIGRLHFQKNQLFLLEVFSEIKKIKTNSVLLLVGDGEDLEKLKQRAKDLKIDDSVNFLGLRDNIPDLLQIMDVFVFPSLFEGLPLALIEAQASSLPVFTSEGCISPDIKMTDFLYFISLESGPVTWAEKICDVRDCRENLDISGITAHGYDINFEVTKLQEYFKEV